MDVIKAIENEQIRENIKNFSIGDTIKVYFKIIEGKTERIQVFEGICIAIKGSGIKKTFTVRKISYGVGVERIFPLNSPKIHKIEMVRRGRIRRAKLYYLRKRAGKAAKGCFKVIVSSYSPVTSILSTTSANKKEGLPPFSINLRRENVIASALKGVPSSSSG